MKISKEVGRMALDALGTAPEAWPMGLLMMAEYLGWWVWSGEEDTTYPSDNSDTLLCLIASIAGVKP